MESANAPGVTGMRGLFDDTAPKGQPLWPGTAAVLILGPPGSGKGTQASRLSEKLGVPHISTGDMLRERILRGDKLGTQIAARIDVGQFVPDEWINHLLDERLRYADCRTGFILDGYPRTLPQAARLVERARRAKWPLRVIRLQMEASDLARRFEGRRQCDRCGALYHIHFQPSLAGEQCDRVHCGGVLTPRVDDKEEFLQRRLDDFERLTKPVIDFFETNGVCVLGVAASGAGPEVVHQRLWQALADHARQAC